MRKGHNEFWCRLCLKYIRYSIEYAAHRRSAHNSLYEQCRFCCKWFATKEQLQHHAKCSIGKACSFLCGVQDCKA